MSVPYDVMRTRRRDAHANELRKKMRASVALTKTAKAARDIQAATTAQQVELAARLHVTFARRRIDR